MGGVLVGVGVVVCVGVGDVGCESIDGLTVAWFVLDRVKYRVICCAGFAVDFPFLDRGLARWLLHPPP